ncbi:MAG: DUF1330 domain-containing protein [Pseudomonadota bacterium]
MAVFAIVDVTVTEDSWIPDYAAVVHDIAARHGGKYLSRSANITTLEGDETDTTLIALIQFPSLDAVKAFAADPEYAPHLAARLAGTKSHFRVIDDTDVAGTIPYLAKADG